MTCKCLEYGKNYLDPAGFGSLRFVEPGYKVRECEYSTTKPCQCAFCTLCTKHLPPELFTNEQRKSS